MSYYNPYRNYDKGMDDAYCGREAQLPNSTQYMEGYRRALELERKEEERRREKEWYAAQEPRMEQINPEATDPA